MQSYEVNPLDYNRKHYSQRSQIMSYEQAFKTKKFFKSEEFWKVKDLGRQRRTKFTVNLKEFEENQAPRW